MESGGWCRCWLELPSFLEFVSFTTTILVEKLAVPSQEILDVLAKVIVP
jgi:hypothetical protein